MSETAADAPKMKPRPTSPHLSIYRLPFSGPILSIVHRFTEIALALALPFLAWAFLAVLFGPESYANFVALARTPIGRIMMLGWSWCLSFHALYDIRQTFFDSGKGFELPVIAQTGTMVVLGSVVLTALLWLLAFSTQPQIAEVMHG